jgi:hypothetical protein
VHLRNWSTFTDYSRPEKAVRINNQKGCKTMKKLQRVVSVLLTVLMFAAQSVRAQEEKVSAGMVEFFACNWVEGKDMKDLQKINDQFRKWSKKNDSSYSAWTITPQFYSGGGMFDVGWLGAYPDGNAFGKGQDAWMAEGGDLAADFAEVVDCSLSHELSTSVAINAPDGPPGDGVVMFAACNANEGKLGDAYKAHKRAGAAMRGLGSKASAWLFYPALGAADTGADYFLVVATNNYTELGAALEIYTNGGGWQKSQEALAGSASCGSPIVFDARLVVDGSDS